MKKFFGNIACTVLGFAIACAMLLSGSLVFASSALSTGDVNGDGSVNPLDLVILARHLAKWEGYEELPYVGQEAKQFIITETPNQHFCAANGGVTSPLSSTADTEYVGLQYLENGVPTGDVFYFSCEELGIPAGDVDDYLNYNITLKNFNEVDGSFSSAILGEAPDIITTTADSYDPDSGNIVIDGTAYTAVEVGSGTELLNEILVYQSIHPTTKLHATLLTDENGDILDAYGNVVAVFAYESSTGAKYYYDSTSNKVIAAAKALELYGVYVDNETVTYTYTQLVSDLADLMYENAYEMHLFDDDNDGKYERAYISPIYMSVYYTYATAINGKEVAGDGLLYSVNGKIADTNSVTYTNDAAKKHGAVSVFTYNYQLNRFNVIDVLEMQTGYVTKVDSTKYNPSYRYGAIGVTVNGKTYELGYDGTALGYTGADLNGKTTDGAVMGAKLLPYDMSATNKYSVENIATRPFIQYIVDRAAWIDDLQLDTYIGFYAYNGVIVYASELEIEDSYGFAVVEDFVDFDLAKIYLDLWIDGELEKSALVTELDGKKLADLSTYKFSMLLSEKKYFYTGNIYSAQKGEDGYVLNEIVTVDNYADYDLIDAKISDENYAADLAAYAEAMAADPWQTSVEAPVAGEIVFDDGSTRGADRANRLRTSTDTVFYFIDNAECDCKVPCVEGVEVEQCDSINPAMRTVSVFVGQPDDAVIKFNEDTAIWVDALGHGTAETNGRATVVFVINPEDHYGFFMENSTYVMTNLSRQSATIGSAEELGLPEEYDGNYYMYNNAGISLDDASRMNIYSKVELQSNRVYKVDENGVVYLKDTANFGAGVELTDTENHQHWLSAGVVSSMNSNRNYVKYGITDVNGLANTAADAQWAEPNGTVRYYDFVWYSKATTRQKEEVRAEFAALLADVANMAIAGEISTDHEYAEALDYVDASGYFDTAARTVKEFLADFVAAGVEVTADDIEFEEIPDSITGIELVTPLVHADFVDDYVEVEIISGYNAGTYLIDVDDHITDIIVVKQNGLGVLTGEDAIELLNSAPQIMWIGTKDAAGVDGELFSEYLIDGSILFVVGYANNDK